MSTFIANQIEKQAKLSEEKGKKKYQSYFVKTRMYEDFKAEVDVILETDGFDYVIS